MLESRLDNVVYRLGLAPTRAAARQLVNHRHIVVMVMWSASLLIAVKPGDTVGVREKAKSLEVIENCPGRFQSQQSILGWSGTRTARAVSILHRPDRTDIPENIKEQLIVELYSKQ